MIPVARRIWPLNERGMFSWISNTHEGRISPVVKNGIHLQREGRRGQQVCRLKMYLKTYAIVPGGVWYKAFQTPSRHASERSGRDMHFHGVLSMNSRAREF
jgi:hypothetical protein